MDPILDRSPPRFVPAESTALWCVIEYIQYSPPQQIASSAYRARRAECEPRGLPFTMQLRSSDVRAVLRSYCGASPDNNVEKRGNVHVQL